MLPVQLITPFFVLPFKFHFIVSFADLGLALSLLGL